MSASMVGWAYAHGPIMRTSKVGRKMEMKKEFIERVIRERVVDTRKYRYVCHFGWTHASIRRIERRVLGTTEAINGWEVVKEWRTGRTKYGP